MAKDFIPRSDGDKLPWLANFQTKIATIGPLLGLSPAEVTALVTAATEHYAKIQAVLVAKTDLANTVAAKGESEDTNVKLIREKIARMKTHEDYTSAMGEDIGAVSNTPDPDLENQKPTLTIKSYAGYVRLKFTKKGFSGVKIFTRLKGQPGWTFLALDTSSPYDDHRPLTVANQPEEREYMAIGMDGDEEAGEESDIVSVVFGG